MALVISFWFLQGLYVAFIPCDRLLKVRYTSTAKQKSNTVEQKSGTPEPQPLIAFPRQLVWMGTALLAVNIACGITRQERGWPFACYPTFSYPISDVQHGYELCRVASNGKSSRFPWPHFSKRFRSRPCAVYYT
jgi:hypothetical protein